MGLCPAYAPNGDDYILTGERSGISLRMAAQAAIVFARTDPSGRARGISAFLVPLDGPGIARSPARDLGSHIIVRAVLSFDHVRIPASHRLGAEGMGFRQVMQAFDVNRVLIGPACIGAAQVSLEGRRRGLGEDAIEHERVDTNIEIGNAALRQRT